MIAETTRNPSAHAAMRKTARRLLRLDKRFRETHRFDLAIQIAATRNRRR